MGAERPDRQPVLYSITGALTGLTTIVVLLRVASRHVARSPFWWDDWLLWFGAALAIIINALTIYGTKLGLGLKGDQVPEQNVVDYLKILLSIMTIYQWSMSAIKASLLLFYYRLFSPNKWLRWTVYFGLCFILCWHISYFFTLLFQCTPVAFFWDRTIPGGHCLDHGKVNNNAVSVSNAAFNVFTDFICLATPLPVLWRLRLSKLKKACLVIVFGLGGCDIVVSCVRLAYLVDGQTADVTWSNSTPALWTVLELNIAAMCASLPGLMPIISRVVFQKESRFSSPPVHVGHPVFRGASTSGVSTRAFHERFHYVSSNMSNDQEQGRDDGRQKENARGHTHEDIESGSLGQIEGSPGSDKKDPPQPLEGIEGILVTSNVEQKIERSWEVRIASTQDG